MSGKLFQKPFAVEFRCDLREGLLGIAKALVAVCPFAQNVDQANAGLKQQIKQERDQQRSQLQAARAYPIPIQLGLPGPPELPNSPRLPTALPETPPETSEPFCKTS